MSIFDNVVLLHIQGIPKSEASGRTHQVDQVNLKGLEQRFPYQLSRRSATAGRPGARPVKTGDHVAEMIPSAISTPTSGRRWVEIKELQRKTG